jgi:hypothetical protein
MNVPILLRNETRSRPDETGFLLYQKVLTFRMVVSGYGITQ